jgi:hypothetical protein
MDWFTVIVAFISAVIGGLITGYFSWRYYVWASTDLKEASEDLARRHEELNQDLRQEVLSAQQQLRNTHGLIFYMIQLLAEAGQIEPRRDEQGNVLAPVPVDTDLRWGINTFESEKREREERERIAQEERERELDRRPFRGPWRRIRQRIRQFVGRG